MLCQPNYTSPSADMRGTDNTEYCILHLSTLTYCAFCSWPWQWFAFGIEDFPWFVTSNRRISFEGRQGWSAVVFCACEIIQLFSVVFCLVICVCVCVCVCVNKFEVRLVTKKVANYHLYVLKRITGYSVILKFWQDHCVVPQTVLVIIKRTPPSLWMSTAFSCVSDRTGFCLLLIFQNNNNNKRSFKRDTEVGAWSWQACKYQERLALKLLPTSHGLENCM